MTELGGVISNILGEGLLHSGKRQKKKTLTFCLLAQ